MILSFVNICLKIKISFIETFYNNFFKKNNVSKNIFLYKSTNKKISEHRCFLFLKKRIINKKNIYISGGKSLLGIYRKINKNKNLFIKNLFYLTDERLSQKKKNTNYYKVIKILNNKFFFKFNYLDYFKQKNHKLLIKKCHVLIPSPNISILGIGDDGHIGSIFPGKFYGEKKLYVVKRTGERFKRITISENEILKSNFIVFFVNSKKKSSMIMKIIKGEKNLKIPFFRICQNFKRKIYIFYY